jgi:hypothetical protein
MAADEKVRENKLRRIADRRGLQLMKSRSRDPKAVDYGLYALVDVRTNASINPAIASRWVCSWTLDEVESYLGGD